jgi:hypothetical protein
MEVVLRMNNCDTKNICTLCHGGDRMDAPLAASVEGTAQWVCLQCLEEKWAIPGLAKLLDYLNGHLYYNSRANLEAFLCNFDSAEKAADLSRMAGTLRRIAGWLAEEAAETVVKPSPSETKFANGGVATDLDLPF